MRTQGYSRRGAAALIGAGLVAPGAAFADAPAPQAVSELKSRQDALARLTLPVWINGEGPFNFLVDTGANRSVISAELAERLALPARPMRLVHGIAGARQSPAVAVHVIKVGDRFRRRVELSVLPSESLAADGLLGSEWLARQRLTFDFARSRIRIEPGDLAIDGPGKVVVVPAKVRSGHLSLVSASIAAQPVSAFLDSGSSCTVGTPALLELAKSKAALRPDAVHAEVVGATGDRVQGELRVINALKLGGMHLRNLPVVFAPVHTFAVWGEAEQPMILVGIDVMRVFRSVSVNYARREVLFEPPHRA